MIFPGILFIPGKMKRRKPMSQSILVTGGASSGKSRFAVTHFAPYDYVLYLKIGKEPSPELLRRIKFDNEKFGVSWDILTRDEGVDENFVLPGLVGDHKFVILDSVSSFTAKVISGMVKSEEELTHDKMTEIERRITDEIFALRDKVQENRGAIILTTLETGFSVKPDNKGVAAYREILGKVNQRIANTSDAVYFSASGIQFQIR